MTERTDLEYVWVKAALAKLGYTLSQDVAAADMSALRELLRRSDFQAEADVLSSPALSDRFFGPLVTAFFVHDQAELMGFARVLTNQANTTWLSEICVHPAWRGHSIGAALLNDVNRACSTQAFYTAAPHHVVPFFEKGHVTRKDRWVKIFERLPMGHTLVPSPAGRGNMIGATRPLMMFAPISR